MATARETLDLSGLWRFQPDTYEMGQELGWHTREADTRLWREVAVPCSFDQAMAILHMYECVGWYVRRFEAPAGWRGRHVVMRFEGVYARARVWVNGKETPAITDGYLRFDLPVGDLLAPGEVNTVAVRVDNRRADGEVPGTQLGWRPFGGILREVGLIASDRLRIEHVAPTALPGEGGGAGRLTVRATVANARAGAARASVEAVVRDAKGAELARVKSAAAAVAGGGGEAVVELQAAVPGVCAWSPESPALYGLEVRLIEDGAAEGEPVDARQVRVGFRTVAARGGKVLLNGEPVFLAGFNRHEDTAERGMCTDLAAARADLERMKSAGCNFVRLCHYPHHPAELDLCDELGLLVMAEIPLYWWGHDRAVQGEMYERTLAAAKRQVTAMIRRDVAHASVAFWSVSNEVCENLACIAEGNEVLVELARGLDPTRLVTHVSCRWIVDPHFANDDVVCVNFYPTNTHVAGRDLTPATRLWREELAKLHAAYPDRPLFVTEFGRTSMEGLTGTPLGEDSHAEALAAQFAGMDAPYVCGAAIWCFADHAWPASGFDGNLLVSPYGTVTRERRAKRAFGAAAEMFKARRGITPPPAGPDAGPWIVMVRPHLRDIPQAPLPAGCSVRGMRREDADVWADIERDAENYAGIGAGLFLREFGDDPEAWPRRCLLLADERGIVAGTISAWYMRDFLGQDYGRLHWFAIRPSYQGKGLARPLLSHAMNLLASWHERAVLYTSIERLRAIKLYLDYGFVPLLRTDLDRRNWSTVGESLSHPGLAGAVEIPARG